MRIVSVFNSIQGEGCNLGVPCTFIRTAGCNLRCSFCDTDFITEAHDETINQLVSKCMHKLVVVTGGEPTLQAEELKKLIKQLQAADHVVAIESNGTYEHYDELGCYVVVSPKANNMYCFFPSGVAELKYVVTADFNADVAIPESVRTRFDRRIWLQPCDSGSLESIKEMWKKCYNIAMKDDRLRVGVQLHKLLEVE